MVYLHSLHFMLASSKNRTIFRQIPVQNLGNIIGRDRLCKKFHSTGFERVRLHIRIRRRRNNNDECVSVLGHGSNGANSRNPINAGHGEIYYNRIDFLDLQDANHLQAISRHDDMKTFKL